MESLAITPVRLWRDDEPVGWANLELKLDSEATNGVSAHVIDPELETEVGTDERLEAHFTSALDGVAFIGAMDPSRFGKDM